MSHAHESTPMHARLPKNFVLEQRIERYAAAIETGGSAYAGRWAQACAEAGGAPFARVHLDLGCGKGSFIAQMAERHPDTLFIGMDSEPVCVVYAAQLLCERGIRNALVVPGDAARAAGIFADGELAAISINFPTPHPKRRHADKRLTSAAHLEGYRPLLAAGGTVTLRTDSAPLYAYSLPQFEAAGWRIQWASTNDRADHPDTPITEYEERLSAQGAHVHGICAAPSSAPASAAQLEAARALPQSLYEYLPDNLFDGAYIPHGMGYAIENFRNRRTHEQARAR